MKWILIAVMSLISVNLFAKERTIEISPSIQFQWSKDLKNTDSFGEGIYLNYQFHLSPLFTMGINAAFRHYGGKYPLMQLGYGLTMQHHFSSDESMKFRPYASYGLLAHMNWLKPHSSNDFAHDTRLAAGLDWEVLEIPGFLELSYHFSRLRSFDVNAMTLDWIEFNFGWRWIWR